MRPWVSAPARILVAALSLASLSGQTAAQQGAPDLVQLAQARPSSGQALVRTIQQELAARGYQPGLPDGQLGARTRNAIRAYEKDAGLRVTGTPSQALLEKIRAAPPPEAAAERSARQEERQTTTAPVRGSRADLVRSVQRELQVRGYYDGTLDGSSGARTRAAVRAFQRDAGFPVTGDIDERLLAELRVVDSNIRAGRRN